MNNPFEIRDRRKSEWFWCHKSILESGIFQSTKLVYFALCCFSNEKTQMSYPSMNLLAKISGVSKRSVVSAINNLTEAKLLKTIKENGKHNIYILMPVTSARVAQVVLVQSATQNRCNTKQQTGATTTHEVRTNILKEHTKRTGNLINEIRQKHKFLIKSV